jgi:hypothetical protein
MTELESSVAEVASILEELSVPYMLIRSDRGRGVGRRARHLGRGLERLGGAGGFRGNGACLVFATARLPADPIRFAEETRVLPLLSSLGIRLDLVFAELPAERDLIARAQAKQLGGRPVNVATVEDLI